MIDYKELSVGDWVIYTEFDKQVIDRVECVEKNRVFLEHAKLYTPINYIEPIPLTEEILEKNGFEKVIRHCKTRDIQGYQYEDVSGKLFCVRAGEFAWVVVHLVNETPRWGVYNSIKLFNVNELQHFLRLCGIDKEIEL